LAVDDQTLIFPSANPFRVSLAENPFMPTLFRLSLYRTLIPLAALLLSCELSLAEEDERRTQVVPLPKYQQECGACHLAFPADMLPAPAWQRVMKGLKQHFGVDASLDAATAAELSAWLGAHADSEQGAANGPPQNRISRTDWFVREHGEVTAVTWKRPAVKSAANCAACHRTADQGDFSEHNIHIPR
jgi:hypothetical protein